MKLKKDPIGVDTLEEYLADASDFAFELRILEMLTAREIDCEHGGQYKDPDTKKFREFDIRARVTRGHVTLAAAIECKSIGHHFPLLVSCVPRSEAEAYHQMFFHDARRKKEEPRGFGHLPQIELPRGKEGMPVSPSSLYPEGAPVGKSTAQVGRRESNAELHANDAEFFEKWTQALQSLDDLVSEIASDDFVEDLLNGRFHLTLALPIVVVPNDTLWEVNYAADGRREGPPAQVDRVSIYVGRNYWNSLPGDSIFISHLEVMTEQGLARFCDTYLADEEAMRLFGPAR